MSEAILDVTQEMSSSRLMAKRSRRLRQRRYGVLTLISHRHKRRRKRTLIRGAHAALLDNVGH